MTAPLSLIGRDAALTKPLNGGLPLRSGKSLACPPASNPKNRTMIEIISYQSVNGVHFGSPEAALVEALGDPAVREINNDGSYELHYPRFIARLDEEGRAFREFTLLRGCVARINS